MIKYYLSKIFKKLIILPSIKKSKIHKTSRISNGSSVISCNIDKYSYVGDYTYMSNVDVGKFTSVSSFCAIGGGNHTMDWVSTSPVFNSYRSILRYHFSNHEFNPHKTTYIGNDVWIGAHVLIKSGVKISDGAVIGMGSVVTKDIGPYEIWAGNPARMIRKRFTDDVIEQLLQTKWWDLGDKKIKYYAQSMNDVGKFLEQFNGDRTEI